MRLRILLVTYYLIQKILIEMILDVHVKGIKLKNFLIQMLLRCIFYKKDS